MARLSVQTIFEQVASTVNQDPTMPTAGSTEYKLFLAYLNRAVYEWSEAYDWTELRKTFYPTVSGLTQATTALPQDFRKLANFPKHWGIGVTGGEDFPHIVPEEASLYETTDKYVYLLGNISDGYNLIWNPGTLSSGASIAIQYFSTPTSLASPAQVAIVPDSQFLVDRVIGYILEARSDSRFQEIETKARERLLNMVEQADEMKYNSYGGKTPVKNTMRLQSFRIGRDG